jgi:ABC-type nitrate/sulfonate/bicarbonate transport system substrate-binding protein
MAVGHHHLFHLVAPTVAKAKGWFEAEGITNYEFVITGTDERTLLEMNLGKIQIGMDPKPALVIKEHLEGSRFFIVGGWLNKPPFSLVGAKGIKTVQDLKGKRVGSRELGGIDAVQMKNYLRSQGLDPEKDIELIVSGMNSRAQQQPLLDSGKLQAAMILRGEAPGMVPDGYTLLVDFNDVYPDGFPQRVIAVTGEFLEKHANLIKPFLKAMIRAFRMMNQNYPETLKIINAAVARGELKWDRDIDHELWKTKYPFFDAIPADGMVTRKGLETVVREGRSVGKIPESFKMEDILRLEYVIEAAKEVDAQFGQGYE